MFSSPLRRAIARGMKPGGDLVKELQGLDDYAISSKKDAKAICEALQSLSIADCSSKSVLQSPLYALAGLFQDVDGTDVPAYEVLYLEGLPELVRMFDELMQTVDQDDPSDLLYVLKILAMYGAPAGTEKVIASAKLPLAPDGYLWHVILGIYSDGHPHRDDLFQALSDPLPEGFLAIALLDAANGPAIAGELDDHPFDSPAGWQMLREWLENPDESESSYAHSATAALPFISNPARDQLLALAMDHADTSVQLEAAWAAGKLGRESGLKVLARYCLDVNHSDVATRYLAELDREDLIPNDSQDDTFRAKAAFSQWLAHPNELGQAPDELEIIDHRQLAWPPDRELRPFWVIRYRMRDQTGLEADDVDAGLVGSATWCFFTYKMHQRPPEDVYAIHCYWEMQYASLIDENDVDDADEYAGMLSQWQGETLEAANLTTVAEVSPKLGIASHFVALATAQCGGQEGWVVLDGPRSRWYPATEQPEGTHARALLMIHIGRQLLGFENELDRRKHLELQESVPTSAAIIEAYERFMSEAGDANPQRQEELLGSHSLLARHFDRYVDACVEVNGTNKEETIVRVYQRFLELVGDADESVREATLDSFSVVGHRFDEYVDALVAIDAAGERSGKSTAHVTELIETFSPHWDHNLGYGKLGTAAYKVGLSDDAERFCLKLRDGLDSAHRCEEMSILAEIWCQRGQQKEAKELLVDCLRKIIVDIQESKYASDREMFADEFRHHRTTFLRLFARGNEELESLGIPAEPQ